MLSNNQYEDTIWRSCSNSYLFMKIWYSGSAEGGLGKKYDQDIDNTQTTSKGRLTLETRLVTIIMKNSTISWLIKSKQVILKKWICAVYMMWYI